MLDSLRSLLRYAWALPATLVGIVLATVACAFGATVIVTGGTLEVAGGLLIRIVSLLPRPVRFSAITLGHVIIGTSHPVLARCRAHECVHVRQYERWGVLFFPLYLGSSLWQILRGRSPYRHNHFERQAFREDAGRGETV